MAAHRRLGRRADSPPKIHQGKGVVLEGEDDVGVERHSKQRQRLGSSSHPVLPSYRGLIKDGCL